MENKLWTQPRLYGSHFPVCSFLGWADYIITVETLMPSLRNDSDPQVRSIIKEKTEEGFGQRKEKILKLLTAKSFFSLHLLWISPVREVERPCP
jgi:hypothetical protein